MLYVALDRNETVGLLGGEATLDVLAVCVKSDRSVPEIVSFLGIAPTTAYRRVRQLVQLGLLTKARIGRRPDGKAYETYRSLIKGVNISLEENSVKIFIIPNDDMTDRFVKAWGIIGGAKS